MGKIIRYTLFFQIALIPLVFTTINYELFEFPKFIVLLSSTLFIATLWIFDSYKKEDWSVPKSPLTIPVLVFLASQIVSTVLSIDPHTSLWGYYSRFHQGLITTLCYTVIYFAAIKYLDKKSVKTMIKVSLSVSAAVSLYAILQKLGIDKNLWQQDVVNRPFSTLGQPNWMASYIIPNIFLAIYYLKEEGKNLGYAKWGLLFLLYSSLILSKSRSGYIAFAVSFVVFFAFRLFKEKGKTVGKSMFSHLAILASVALIFGTVWTRPIHSYLLNQGKEEVVQEESQGTQLETGGTESGEIRKIVWQGAIDIVSEYPVFGTGVETFAYSYYWHRPVEHNYVSEWEFLYNKAHNEYLNLAATSGILGLLTNLSILVVFGVYTIRNRKNILVLSSGAALLSIFITNFFGFSVIPVAYLMYILPALSFSRENEPKKDSEISATAVTIACLTLIIPARIFVADLNYAKGRNLFLSNQIVPSTEYFQKATSLRPDEPQFYSTYAEALSQIAAAATQENDPRKDDFIRATLEAAEKTKKSKYNLNLLKSRAKSYLTLAESNPQFNQLALEELEFSRTLAPTDPKLAYNLGLLYSRVGSNQLAIEQMEESISLKKDYPLPYYALALLYEEEGSTDKVIELLEKARENLRVIPEQVQNKIDTYL